LTNRRPRTKKTKPKGIKTKTKEDLRRGLAIYEYKDIAQHDKRYAMLAKNKTSDNDKNKFV